MNKLVNIIIAVAIIVIIALGIMVIIKIEDKPNNNNSYEERIDEILADDKEIERKWLINKEEIPYDLNAKEVEQYDIRQTYFCFDPEMRVRKYNDGQWYELTIKSNMSSDGLIRDEINLVINEEQYENIIKKQEGITIHKTRYQFYDNGEVIAIDIFHDDLDGLAYMEIEFANEEESRNYIEPDWVIKDVTSDKNYKNGYLARFGIPIE